MKASATKQMFPSVSSINRIVRTRAQQRQKVLHDKSPYMGPLVHRDISSTFPLTIQETFLQHTAGGVPQGIMAAAPHYGGLPNSGLLSQPPFMSQGAHMPHHFPPHPSHHVHPHHSHIATGLEPPTSATMMSLPSNVLPPVCGGYPTLEVSQYATGAGITGIPSDANTTVVSMHGKLFSHPMNSMPIGAASHYAAGFPPSSSTTSCADSAHASISPPERQQGNGGGANLQLASSPCSMQTACSPSSSVGYQQNAHSPRVSNNNGMASGHCPSPFLDLLSTAEWDGRCFFPKYAHEEQR